MHRAMGAFLGMDGERPQEIAPMGVKLDCKASFLRAIHSIFPTLHRNAKLALSIFS